MKWLKGQQLSLNILLYIHFQLPSLDIDIDIDIDIDRDIDRDRDIDIDIYIDIVIDIFSLTTRENDDRYKITILLNFSLHFLLLQILLKIIETRKKA